MVNAQRGFTYLGVLFAVAILSGGLALVGEMWDTAAQREREAELLFIGNEYRLAISRYYHAGPQRQYPTSLEDLLEDPRRPGVERYLRRLYPDPVTGGEWVVIRGPQGVVGVRSASQAHPLKTGGFALRDAAFEKASSYSEWQFVYTPREG